MSLDWIDKAVPRAPERPKSARDCSSCDGTGRHPVRDGLGCVDCHGKGWLPKGQAGSSSHAARADVEAALSDKHLVRS